MTGTAKPHILRTS